MKEMKPGRSKKCLPQTPTLFIKKERRYDLLEAGKEKITSLAILKTVNYIATYLSSFLIVL